MKNVSKQVKKTLNESISGSLVTPETDTVNPDCDCFAHLIYGCSYWDLEENFDTKSEIRDAKRNIESKMKDFANVMKQPLANLGIMIKYKRGGLTITGITSDNYWDYIDALSRAPFPGELYSDDLACFVPDSDVDEDEFYEKTQDWCWD